MLACKSYGCPKPEWDFDGTGLDTTLWFKKNRNAHDVNKPVRDVVEDGRADNQSDTILSDQDLNKLEQVVNKLEQAMNKLGRGDLTLAISKDEYSTNLLNLLEIYYKKQDNAQPMSALLKKTPGVSRLKLRRNYLLPLIDIGFIEMTIPLKPNSPNQMYRLTDKARQLLNAEE